MIGAAWSPTESARLASLYPTHTASQIAAMLGRTRGAVLCQATQQGLRKTLRPTRAEVAASAQVPISTARAAGVLPVRRPSDRIEQLFDDDPVARAMKALKPGLCCWPTGDAVVRVHEFRYCLERVVPGRSYCPEHRQLAVAKTVQATSLYKPLRSGVVGRAS